MFQVQEINSFDELAALRGVWTDLLAQSEGATFFQSLEWLETYWQFYGHEGKLRVLVVNVDGAPVGILPLTVVREPRRVGPVRVLGYPLAGWGSFYGPLGPQPGATLLAGLQHIRNTPRDWDLIDLRWVDSQGIDRGQTPQAFSQAGFTFDSQVWHTSAQVELDHGWDHYWQARNSRWRSGVRRCRRRLEQRGRIEFHRYRPRGAAQGESDPRWDLFDACVQLAERSWQGSSTTGTTMSHDRVRDYLRAAHFAAVNAGAADLMLLRLDGAPLAFSYNYHHGGWVYGLRTGYDRSAAQEGAGTVLAAEMIEDSCRRGDRLIDLGPNYLECKRYWLTRLQPAYHYTHFHPAGVRAQALRLKRIVKRWLGRTTPAHQDRPVSLNNDPLSVPPIARAGNSSQQEPVESSIC